MSLDSRLSPTDILLIFNISICVLNDFTHCSLHRRGTFKRQTRVSSFICWNIKLGRCTRYFWSCIYKSRFPAEFFWKDVCPFYINLVWLFLRWFIRLRIPFSCSCGLRKIKIRLSFDFALGCPSLFEQCKQSQLRTSFVFWILRALPKSFELQLELFGCCFELKFRFQSSC